MSTKRIVVLGIVFLLFVWLISLKNERVMSPDDLTSEELVNTFYEVSTFHFKNKEGKKVFAAITPQPGSYQLLYKKTDTRWQRIIFPVERIGGKIVSIGYEYPSETIWVKISKNTKNGPRVKLYIYNIVLDDIEETPAMFTMD